MDCIYIELFMSYTVDHSSTGEELERVTSFKFLGVHIAEYLTWSLNTSCIIKRAQQRLFFLRTLRRNRCPQRPLIAF